MLLAASTFSVTVGILQILGALGVFLYGMKVMSEGVQKVAGDRMRAVLAGMTGNRFKGILTGFVTTTMVQSSSASTVLVVSFVNAGLLSLIQAIGVIMGANLGTTTTAWIVALIGKFDVAKIALPLIGIGLPLFFVGRERLKNQGETLIGFGLVFFGLGLLKDSVPDLRNMIQTDPGTAEMIRSIVTSINGHGFGTVLLFLLLGVVLTLCVQSSSAAMAITMTCALNGWLGDIDTNPIGVFQNSAAIVLGENIGTTVTAWLASLGANTNAKRAARAHFSFNIFGVLWCLCLFYPFSALIWNLANHLPASLRSANQGFSQSEIAFGTAIFHSSFNFLNICIMVWFVPQIAKFVNWWVSEPATPEGRDQLKFISSGLVDIGELSLAEADGAVRKLAGLASEMYDGMVDVMGRPKEDLSKKVMELKAMEQTADEMLKEITDYLIQCSTHEIGTGNAAHISCLLRVVTEFEESTDRIHRLVQIVQRRYNKERHFLAVQEEDLGKIAAEVRLLLDMACQSLEGVDASTAARAQEIENRVDVLRKTNNKAAAQRMQQGGEVQTEMLFIDLNNHFEAVADHALNIIQAHR